MLRGARVANDNCITAQVLRGGVGTFDCKTTADGTSTLTADPSIGCTSADSDWVTLVPWSIASLCLYGVGIPGLIAGILFHYRKLIVEDQLLKEVGKGDSPKENPNLHVRKRFGRVYNDFRARYYYWRLVMIARKLLLVLVAAYFHKNSMFQASAALLVIDAIYVAHSATHPFLGAASAGTVAFDLAALGQYRFDYNRLEGGLLLTSGTVLIAGMIFSSEALTKGSASYWAITAIVIGGVGCAVVSFMAVLALEIFRSFKFALRKPQGASVTKPAVVVSKGAKGGQFAISNPLRVNSKMGRGKAGDDGNASSSSGRNSKKSPAAASKPAATASSRAPVPAAASHTVTVVSSNTTKPKKGPDAATAARKTGGSDGTTGGRAPKIDAVDLEFTSAKAATAGSAARGSKKATTAALDLDDVTAKNRAAAAPAAARLSGTVPTRASKKEALDLDLFATSGKAVSSSAVPKKAAAAAAAPKRSSIDDLLE